jgi:hypothetical protein
MTTLINMELTAAEAKQEVSPEAEAPKYPWGLCLTLDNESLKKLNIDTLPTIGTKMRIIAEVEVSAVRSYAGQGEADTSVDLQVTDMAIDDGSSAMTRAAGTLYGK